MPLASATRVGPYEILSTLGEGAMGEVYRARDSRLSRNVALKVIGSDSVADPTRRRRFNQEARSASSLNHPNIVTVHDFGTEDGISYIVSELVEGESLRQIIKRGPVPIRKLLDFAVQIAEGLAAAHMAGIVHRDLKPENIMVTPDGRVKILDFGLAKPILPEAEEGDENETSGGLLASSETNDPGSGTQPGLILGTVGYMSPEQARGLPVSFQSDQFSLGIVLHEMASGSPAFRRETPMQTLLAIANVDRIPFTPGPVALRLLVERCLNKNPEKRWASTTEIAERLRKIRDQISDKAVLEMPRRSVVPTQLLTAKAGYWALGTLGLLALLSVGYWLLSRPKAVDLSSYHFAPLVTETSIAFFPALHPKEDLVAYSAVKNGIFQIFTRALTSSTATQLTAGPQDSFFPFWSAHGQRVFFISAGSLFAVSSSGGSPELVFPNVAQAAISPDGNILALLRNDVSYGQAFSLWLSKAGAAPRRYAEKPLAGMHFLATSYLQFSPDGKMLGLWAALWNARSALWMIPLAGGEPSQALSMLNESPLARAFDWMPNSRDIVYAERSGLSRDEHLWTANTRSGVRSQLTNGTGREQAPTVSQDGKAVAFSSLSGAYSTALIPLNSASFQIPPVALTNSVSPSMSPIRPEYVYATDRGGSPEIWLTDQSSGWERSLVTQKDFPDPTNAFLDLSFSPDSQRIAYRRLSSAGEAIWISGLNGGSPARLNAQDAEPSQRTPTWSPDGNWIAFTSLRNGKYALLKSRVGAAGRPTVVSEDVGTAPVWSPKGNRIAVIGQSGSLSMISPDGANLKTVSDGPWLAVAWTRDGSRLIGLRRSANRHLSVASLNPDSGASQDLTDLGPYPPDFSYGEVVGDTPVRGASLSPDGKFLLTSLLQVRGSLWDMRGGLLKH